MWQAIIDSIVEAFRTTFFSGDWRTIAIALAAAVIASFLMSRRGQVGSMTLLALVTFAIGGLLRLFFEGGGGEGVNPFARAGAVIEGGVLRLIGMSAGMLIAYFIAFAAVILVLFGLRFALARNGGAGH